MDFTPILLTVGIPAVVGLLATLATNFFNNRVSTKSRREPSWVELHNSNAELRTEVDGLRDDIQALSKEVRSFKNAVVNVLTDAERQWPVTHEGPVFAPEDLKVLEDTMPPRWRMRRYPSVGTA